MSTTNSPTHHLDDTSEVHPADTDGPTVGHVERMQRSGRDLTDIPRLLTGAVAATLPPGTQPSITLDGDIEANGMSSETILLTGRWHEASAAVEHRWVMRLAPTPQDVPIFATYRLDHQYAVMRLAAALTDVPIPPVSHLDADGTTLGSQFFLMDRVDGLVPPDVMPYTFGDNWLADATAEQQDRLQNETVSTIAELHQIPDALTHFDFLRTAEPEGATGLHRRLRWLTQWYEFAAGESGRSPLVDRALTWLGEHFPDTAAHRGDVLCWGDARIGNVIYQDFRPAAVLDWEMACIGPRELDISWLIFAHNVFQELGRLGGLPGMPDFLREEDVRNRYRELTGVQLDDLRWFYIYAGVVWCCVFLRAGARRVHFGEVGAPTDIDNEWFYHRTLLIRLLDGGDL